MKQLLIVVLLFFLMMNMYSCGPSAAEVAQIQQHREDSIKTAIERKYAVKAELKEVNNEASQLASKLRMAKANLETAKDGMDKLKDFHFLRTADEREQQIRQQSLSIQFIEENIEAIQKRIGEDEERMSALKGELQRY